MTDPNWTAQAEKLAGPHAEHCGLDERACFVGCGYRTRVTAIAAALRTAHERGWHAGMAFAARLGCAAVCQSATPPEPNPLVRGIWQWVHERNGCKLGIIYAAIRARAAGAG